MSSDRPTDDERERVRTLLGREPRGEYAIVVRDQAGEPVVLENSPLLDDGTPMPTRYWLIGPAEHRRIGQLESAGGVDAAEAAIDPDVLAAAHQRYADERDRALPADHVGPVPSGGVGGTRVGVKCLHAHWAWYLAGGDDPVGVWIASQFDEAEIARTASAGPPASAEAPSSSDLIDIGANTTRVVLAGYHTATARYQPPNTVDAADQTPIPEHGPIEHNPIDTTIPWGTSNLTTRWLVDNDPPAPADLTNSLGTVDDELDDLVRTYPNWSPSQQLRFAGPGITALVALELGHRDGPATLSIERSTIEELFRLTATAARHERADNPGLGEDEATDIVAVCCIVLAVMRRFEMTAAEFVRVSPDEVPPARQAPTDTPVGAS